MCGRRVKEGWSMPKRQRDPAGMSLGGIWEWHERKEAGERCGAAATPVSVQEVEVVRRWYVAEWQKKARQADRQRGKRQAMVRENQQPGDAATSV